MKKNTFKSITDIKAIKLPVKKGQQDTYRDAIEHGLCLRVTSNGVRTFIFRRKVNGKPERITLGHWPDMTIEQARSKADAIRRAFGRGQNPAEERRQEKRIESSSVEAVGDEWLERHIDVNVDWPEARRIMKKDVIPAWSNKLVAEVSRPDIQRLIDSIVDRGSKVAANRIFAVVRAWLNWTVQRGYISVSPANGIQPPTAEKSRDRVLNDSELAEILRAAGSIEYPLGPFFVLLAMLAQRRGEVAGMRWEDVDLDKKMWTLQAEATKARRIHDVPLPTQAVSILETLPRHKTGTCCFTTTDGAKSVNGFSKAKLAIDRAIADKRREARIKQNIAPWTPHDLRRTAATGMAKSGVPPHVLAAILNHTPGSTQGVTHIYNRFRYTEERRTALQAWADHLDSLTRTIAVEVSA